MNWGAYLLWYIFWVDWWFLDWKGLEWLNGLRIIRLFRVQHFIVLSWDMTELRLNEYVVAWLILARRHPKITYGFPNCDEMFCVWLNFICVQLKTSLGPLGPLMFCSTCHWHIDNASRWSLWSKCFSFVVPIQILDQKDLLSLLVFNRIVSLVLPICRFKMIPIHIN